MIERCGVGLSLPQQLSCGAEAIDPLRENAVIASVLRHAARANKCMSFTNQDNISYQLAYDGEVGLLA